MGRWLIVIGIVFIILGVILGYAPWLVNWFGKLPGDIRYDSGNVKIFFPITSMLIVSVVINIIFRILVKYM